MEVMKFYDLKKAAFVTRINRFVGKVKINGKEELVHIRDSGRLGELLKRGALILLRKKDSGKLHYELIAVYREGYGWVFTNSGYHNQIVEALIKRSVIPEFKDVIGYGKEVSLEEGRLDFVLVYRDHARLLEVKGCTLFEGETCMFPDAPTERGRKHLKLLESNAPAALLFLSFSDKVTHVSGNHNTDPSFTSTLIGALNRGVHIWGLSFSFSGNTLYWKGRIPFVYPVYRDTLFMMEALKEVSRGYNEFFSPEANALPVALWSEKNIYFNVLFWGYLCVSCGLFDYFEDFSIYSKNLGIFVKPIRYVPFGNSFVVTYRMEENVTIKRKPGSN